MLTNNKNVLNWVEEMVALTKPDKVVWIDGSEEQLNGLREEAMKTGEMIKLNEEKLPGCFLHRTAVNDVLQKRRGCRPDQQLVGSQRSLRDPGQTV